MKNRAVVLMPYFGGLPPYLGLYLKSVEGKHFDVVFFTDLEIGKHPDNVRVESMTFDEFRSLARVKLGVPVVLETPKKLCDFKPLYGKILEDYIRGYDYWMLGDCDLIFGNAFNAYLDAVIAAGWDIVSMRKPWLSGPCSILKNCEKINMLFTRARNWSEMVAEFGPNNLWDECGSTWHNQLELGQMSMLDCERVRDSFGAVVFRSKDISFRHDDDITECGLQGRVIDMSSTGRLTLDGDEISIFHYIGIKTRNYCRFSNVPFESVSHYQIDDCGLYAGWFKCCFRRPINLFRKLSALAESVRKNGFSHWVHRIVNVCANKFG